MSVLNTLFCGGQAAQPPEGEYRESCLYGILMCVFLNMYYSSTTKYMYSHDILQNTFSWSFFTSLSHTLMCVSCLKSLELSVICPGHIRPFSPSCCHFSDLLVSWKGLKGKLENTLLNTYSTLTLQSVSFSHCLRNRVLKIFLTCTHFTCLCEDGPRLASVNHATQYKWNVIMGMRALRHGHGRLAKTLNMFQEVQFDK